MSINVQEPHEMSALVDAHARKFGAQLLGAMLRGKAGEAAPQRLHLRRAVEPQKSTECGGVFLLEMLGPLDAQQRHEQQRDQRCAQPVESWTNLTVVFAADPNEPALYQTPQSQQDTDTRNRRSLAEQRCSIIEQPEVGELPIKRPIFSVAVEAHRYRLILVRSLGRGDQSAVCRVLFRRSRGAISIFVARRGR